MEPKKKQGFFSVFLNNGKAYSLLTALAAGLYPLLFYYTNNYKMINSWEHLGYFVSIFLLLPMVVPAAGVLLALALAFWPGPRN